MISSVLITKLFSNMSFHREKMITLTVVIFMLNTNYTNCDGNQYLIILIFLKLYVIHSKLKFKYY